MLEELKEITINDMLTIDNEDVLEFTETEDFTIAGVKSYSQDEGDMVIIDLESHFLIAHTLNDEPRYYIVEQAACGSPDDLEDGGFRLIIKNEMMPRKLYSGRNDREIIYFAKYEPIYGMNVERDDSSLDESAGEVSICEYKGRTKIKSLSVILLERLGEKYKLYQGLQISEASILL